MGELSPRPSRMKKPTITPPRLGTTSPRVTGWSNQAWPPSPAQTRNGSHRNRNSSSRVRGVGKAVLLACLLINALIMVRFSLFSGRGHHVQKDATDKGRLGVIVPAHAGDLRKALDSLAHWPRACSETTLRHVELVLYYAGNADDDGWSNEVLPELEQTGGRCFSRTKVIFGDLTKEENVYPLGPSVQFYKLFLNEPIRAELTSYGAIAIIEWDVLVVHDRSFEELYRAAFEAVEPFWVKGSTLAGTNFHGTAAITDHWKVLGHINGNAIYNNSDPEFVQFVDFTLARWEYSYSYDVALWATIADFPYSWPLWQRFSSKFVTTNLIANVGFLDVDSRTVGKALARDTMFIHGSLTGGGGTQFVSEHTRTVAAAAAAAAAAEAGSQHSSDEAVRAITPTAASGRTVECSSECGSPLAIASAGGNGVRGAGRGRAISSSDSSNDKSGLFTVCDHSCASLSSAGSASWQIGGGSCGAGDERKYGSHCRMCYKDVGEALRADRLLERQAQQAGHEGVQHVVMCDTMRPPESPNCSPKCATKLDTICDQRCGSGNYGDYNCNWRGRGGNCRFCFDDLDAAIVADEAAKRNGGRVIMCDTHEPPVPRMQLEMGVFEAAAIVTADEEDDEEAAEPKEADEDSSADPPIPPADIPYSNDLVRGNLCAFTTGYFTFLEETRASVRSLSFFMPGMRVRVAVDPVYFSVFNRTMGDIPDVVVVNATTAGGHASLMADVHCGEGTKLIYYLGPGEVLSRTFTRKDTHSTRGELLVPFTEPERLDEFHIKRSRATTSVLGFGAPSFSYGTDLILPAWINRRLRHLLLTGSDHPDKATARTAEQKQQLATSIVLETEGAHVPELLAGLAYSQNPPGIWFLNPQQWVMHHMFQQASIWDIPLVKPRFGCATAIDLTALGYDVAHELSRFADFSGDGGGGGGGGGGTAGGGGSGGKCETGFLHLDPSQLRPKPTVEFGLPAAKNRPMPRVEWLRVSLIYDAVETGDAWMLDATLPTVLKNFPGAKELVVVAEDETAAAAFDEVFDGYRESAPYELRVVLASDIAGGGHAGGHSEDEDDGASRDVYPLVWADKYCTGNFVLHLAPDSVLLKKVTYDDIFHFRKPVIPFTRFTEVDVAELQQREYQHPGNACWRSKASRALDLSGDEAVVHDFSKHNTHVYPVALYPALRAHLRAVAASDTNDDPNTRRRGTGSLEGDMLAGECDGTIVPAEPQAGMAKRRRFRREMQFNLMATFMWYRMHGSAHWRAIDPLDLRPDEWLADPQKYTAWWCSLGAEQQVGEGRAWEQGAAFRGEVAALGTWEECEALGARFNAERASIEAAAATVHY